MEIGDALQSLLYGQLTVDIQKPTHLEQLEILRAVVANPSAIRRLKIAGEVHPWVSMLLETVREKEKTPCETTEQSKEASESESEMSVFPVLEQTH